MVPRPVHAHACFCWRFWKQIPARPYTLPTLCFWKQLRGRGILRSQTSPVFFFVLQFSFSIIHGSGRSRSSASMNDNRRTKNGGGLRTRLQLCIQQLYIFNEAQGKSRMSLARPSPRGWDLGTKLI